MWKQKVSAVSPRWWVMLFGAVAVIVGAAAATPLLAQNATHKEYTLPQDVRGLALDPSGDVWTTSTGQMFRLNPNTNLLTTYSHAVAFGASYGVGSESGGNIWFTNNVADQCRINELDPATGDITSWTWGISNCEQYPVGVDSLGNVWFGGPDEVRMLEPGTDTISTWLMAATPTGIAVDSQDRIWLLLAGSNSVALLDPGTSSLRTWPAPGTAVSSRPRSISLDGQDRAWFGAEDVFIDPETVNVIARLDETTNEMTKYVCPPGLCSTPGSVAVDVPSGIVWFGERETLGLYEHFIQRMDPAANPPLFTRWDVRVSYLCPYPEQVISDGAGGVWFIFYGRAYNSGIGCHNSFERWPHLHGLQPF